KGGRIKFWLPPDLAWGKKGAGTKIGPYAVLAFDMKLIDFY
ncbi:MAG: FKBP-type peptidyl-prolyl cis-trans isomerase, partial [Planctomycetes bacterium]|nr:FKBP-type peptidyl-prolyl cis-trans isomerase [Planctomycetota bacterium]